MNRLPWPEAKTLLAVDQQLAHAFTALYDSRTLDERELLCVYLGRYRYADYVIQRGEPRDDEQAEFPENLVLPRGLPFGIVVRHALEVSEAIVGSSGASSPQAIMSPGTLLGLFELMDEICNAPRRSSPDWTITAGSRNIYSLRKHNTNLVDINIKRAFNIRDPKRHPQLVRWLEDSLSDVFEPIRDNWRADVLFFAPAWFEWGLSRGVDDSNLRGEERYLLSCLAQRAWHASASVRQSSGTLYDVLNAWGSTKDPEVLDAAYELVAQTSDVLHGIRPAFSPADENEDLGPFRDLAEEIFQPALEIPHVLRPAYLSAVAGVGYLRLKQISPRLFGERMEAGLHEVVRVLEQSMTKALEEGDMAAQRAIDAGRLSDHLMFRVPDPSAASGKASRTARNEGRREGALLFRFREKPRPKAGGSFILEKQSVEPKAFYAPHFIGPDFPGPRCEFYVGSVRICKDP